MTFHPPATFSCDTCPEVLDTEVTDSRDAFKEMKRAGWRSYKGPDDEWAHACPLCTKQWAKEQKDRNR